MGIFGGTGGPLDSPPSPPPPAPPVIPFFDLAAGAASGGSQFGSFKSASTMPYGRAGAHWALLADGGVTMRRTGYDVAAACAAITEQSSYPDVAEWSDYFLHSRASDADALAVMAPRDGRTP